MDNLARGFGLFRRYCEAVRKAWHNGLPVPFRDSAEDWAIEAALEGTGMHSGAAFALSGYGMQFTFRIGNLASEYAPSFEDLALSWAAEKKWGAKPLTQDLLRDLIGNTYNAERYTSMFTLQSFSKIFALMESPNLTESDKQTLQAGEDCLQRHEKPSEDFWELLARQPAPSPEKQREIVSRVDAEVAERLYSELKISRRELGRHIKSANDQVIYFLGVPQEEVLAQMCIFAYRQTKAEKYAEYLLHYVKKLTREDDFVVNAVVMKLLREWAAPPTEASFRVYIMQQATNFRRAEKRARQHGGTGYDLNFPISVPVAARLLCEQATNADPANVARWVYSQLERGAIPSAGSRTEVVTPAGIALRQGVYALDREAFEAVKALWEAKQARRALVQLIAGHRGITPRAARKLIAERVGKGQALEEVGRDVLASR